MTVWPWWQAKNKEFACKKYIHIYLPMETTSGQTSNVDRAERFRPGRLRRARLQLGDFLQKHWQRNPCTCFLNFTSSLPLAFDIWWIAKIFVPEKSAICCSIQRQGLVSLAPSRRTFWTRACWDPASSTSAHLDILPCKPKGSSLLQVDEEKTLYHIVIGWNPMTMDPSLSFIGIKLTLVLHSWN